MMRFLKYIVFATLFIAYFLCYQGALSHVIIYHEQHHLFLFSSAYFHRTVLSEGFLSYATNFFIQFFFHPTWGSALLAFLLAGVYYLTDRLYRIVFKSEDLMNLAVIPSLALFLHTMSVDHTLNIVTGSFFALLLANMLLSVAGRFVNINPAIVRFLPKRKAISIGIVCLFLALYTAGGYYYFIKQYNVSERIMLRTDQFAKAKQWDKVMEYTENYLRRGRSNQLISYYHNMALYHAGQMPYRLFDYPQALGVKGLYFPWNANSRESEYGHVLYEELGHLNEAHRWEFEAMVVWGETAPHLLNLARYNLAVQRPQVAQRFINVLKQSLFYSDAACSLEQQSKKASDELPYNALIGVNDVPARFSNVVNIGPELNYLCEKDTANRMAFEYLMSHLLLSNHVEKFAKSLKYICNFSYPELPRIYEEALYVYELGVPEEEFAKVGFRVSEETKRRFERYYHLAEKNQMNELQREFGNTYWFYLNYISPYGNKVLTN